MLFPALDGFYNLQVSAFPELRHYAVCVCCHGQSNNFGVQSLRLSLRTALNSQTCFLISAGLTILSFYLPPDSGERLSLVITNLLAMTVFMLLVAEIIPPTSDAVSIISMFYSCCIFEVRFLFQ